MEKVKQILKRLFCLPPLLTVLLAAFGYGLVLSAAVFGIQNPVVVYTSYLASAYALVISITGLPYLKGAAKGAKRYAASHSLVKKVRSTAVGERYLTDVRFRTGVSLFGGLLINLLYIVMKLVSGIYFRSAWFISLAVYYALLAVMRFMLIQGVNTRNMALELKRCRLCGILLLLMNQALAGIVIFMVHQNKGFHYPGLLIYAMACYSFYAVIAAAVNAAKSRRHNSPILSAARAVNLAAAMVSILSLTTAMISAFGDGDSAFRRVMTGAIGGVICTVVIIMAVFMIIKANQRLKRLEAV